MAPVATIVSDYWRIATRPWFIPTLVIVGLLLIGGVFLAVPKLTLSPSDAAKFTGFSGGSFTPDAVNYSLHNRGLPIVWWLKGVPSWIDARQQRGAMLTSGERLIEFRPSAVASQLSPGVYFANIRVMTSSLAEIVRIGLSLEVKSTADKPTPHTVAAPLQLSELANLPCAQVSAAQRDSLKVLTGFVGSEATLDRVRQIADDVPAAVIGDVIIAKPPECNVLKILERPLAAQGAPRIDIGPSDRFREGDVLKINIQAPEASDFLQVFYLQADGTVLRLLGPSSSPVSAGERFTFGDGVEGHRKFTVGPPFGQEMIIAISSAHPLFDAPFPDRQPATGFLSALVRAVETSASEVSQGGVRAAAKILTTQWR